MIVNDKRNMHKMKSKTTCLVLVLIGAIGLTACSDDPFSAGDDQVSSYPSEQTISGTLTTVFEGELGIEPAIEERSDSKAIEFRSGSDFHIPADPSNDSKGDISLKGGQVLSSHLGDSKTSELSSDQKDLLLVMRSHAENLKQETGKLPEITAQEWKKGLMSSKGVVTDLGEGRVEIVRESENLEGQVVKSVLVMDVERRAPASMSTYVDGALFSEAKRSAKTGDFDFVSYDKEFDVLAPREKLPFEFGK